MIWTGHAGEMGMNQDKQKVTRHLRQGCVACGGSVLAWGILCVASAIADDGPEKSSQKKEAKPAGVVEELPAAKKGTNN
jgi:hypothetical protein